MVSCTNMLTFGCAPGTRARRAGGVGGGRCPQGLRAYFDDNGEGLAPKSLDNPTYLEMQLMLSIYNQETTVLMERYNVLDGPSADADKKLPAAAPAATGASDAPQASTPGSPPPPKVPALKKADEMHVRGSASRLTGGLRRPSLTARVRGCVCAGRAKRTELARDAPAQIILQVLQLRGEDATAQKFVRDMALNLAHAKRWANAP